MPLPLINKKIVFCLQEQELITKKMGDHSFTHSDWGKDDLQTLRSSIRAFYRKEQVGICAYCKSDVSLVSASNAHIEHIVPKSIYPQFIFEPRNLCIVCSDCNTIKRNQEVFNEIPDTLAKKVVQYPRSSSAFKIVHPHFDVYDDHILKKGRIYIDLSSKGIFTIGACKLNRYFHEFGFDDDLVDDEELITVMNDFMNGSFIQKAGALSRLRNMLFNM
ncbi:HNH endonuclease [Methylobacter sp.]|uniref:HNH endonuclease n=1 Tax=Methylobacter sp. TaxID=2051955 RepID=UPI002FDD4E66